MRMTAIEKHFVNDPGHTLRVADRALMLLARVDYQPGWRYLDVGCGVGAAAFEVAGRCSLDVTGVDVDPKQIGSARARAANPQPRFETMDATRLEFQDAEFEIVASSMATHHIPRWEQAFVEMVRVLRVGGYLVYTDFMFPSWLAAFGRRFIPFVGIPSKERVDSLAAQSGLSRIHEAHAGLQFDFIWRKSSWAG